MNIKTCLEIGKDCGLQTVGESVYNIELHAMCIFDYAKITEEIKQLHTERDVLFSKTNFSNDSSTETVLVWVSMKNDGVDETKLNL